MYKNKEGYPDPTAGRAVRKADKPPEDYKKSYTYDDLCSRMLWL